MTGSQRSDEIVAPSANATALVVIDMQNAYCHPDGAFARAESSLLCVNAVEPCARAIAMARRAGVPVIFIAKVGLSDIAPYMSFHPTAAASSKFMRVGTWDAAIVDALQPKPDELVLNKLAYSAFLDTPLEGILRRRAIQNIVVIGVTTSICVESTARDGAQRGFKVYVVKDATAEWTASRHERSLEQIGYAFGKVLATVDCLSTWQSTGRS